MSDNSCDWLLESGGSFSNDNSGNTSSTQLKNTSILRKFRDYSWEGIERESHNVTGESIATVMRHVIVGNQGETCRFSLRYFEITGQGYSNLEKHDFEHVVICIRGSGKMVVGGQFFKMEFLDALYIAPNTPHQLLSTGGEPFGFFCIVNAEPNQTQMRLEDELSWLQEMVETKETS